MALVCVVFLLHVRSALVAIITLPLGILIAYSCMWGLGISSNIMSLAGIAIATLLWADLGNRFVWFALIPTMAFGVVGFFVVPVVGLFLGFVLGIYLAERADTLATADAWLPKELTIPLQQPNTMLFTLLMSCVTMQWAVSAVATSPKAADFRLKLKES